MTHKFSNLLLAFIQKAVPGTGVIETAFAVSSKDCYMHLQSNNTKPR